jgi:UDP-glucose 4-epimerase
MNTEKNQEKENYILVTGGLGFIGSHTVIQLLENNYHVLVVDNLSNSDHTVLENIHQIVGDKQTSLTFFQTDIGNQESMEQIFQTFSIQSVIHFAAYKAVAESIQNPLMYYQNNVGNTVVLLSLCMKYGVKSFLFSSSATVYGKSRSPLTEDSEVGVGITNPYGTTKYFIEKILQDLSHAQSHAVSAYSGGKHMKIVILRYFNPVGAHVSGLIGENPKGIPNNLMPFVLKVARQNNPTHGTGYVAGYDPAYEKLSIFGNDYPTHDGTAIRDYIHVTDLANAHLKGLEYSGREDSPMLDVFNIGTGKGTTVMELIQTFTRVNGVKLPYEICEKREGDLDIVFCDTEKSGKILGWVAEKSLDEMCVDSYGFLV